MAKTKAKGTRAKKFDKSRQAAYLKLIARGVGRVKAARGVGCDPRLATQLREENAEFEALFSQAQMAATDEIENSLWKSAKKGNTTAQIFWLLNRDKERWKDLRNTGGNQSIPTMTMQHMIKVVHSTFHVRPDGKADKNLQVREGVDVVHLVEPKPNGDNGNGHGPGT